MEAIPIFNGVQELTIDSKNRIAIPAKFRESLAVLDSKVLCVTLKTRSHLMLYPEYYWPEVVRQLKALPLAGNRVLRQFQKLVLDNMERIEPDAAGRILLPPRLRTLTEFAESKDVVMVGASERLEIWSKQRWDEETREILDINPEILEAHLAQTEITI